jgi:ELWxxDGT repeat protein
VGDKVFFIAATNLGGTSQPYLWTSDGTPEGTQAIGLTPDGASNSTYESHFTAAGNLLFFVSRTATRNRELWRSDGTAAGTFVVKEIGATANGSNPTHLSNIGGVLYFTAIDGTHGAELWASTGTAATTVLIKDFDPETASGNPTQVIQAGNYLFVVATKNSTDREVWIAEAPAPSERGDFNGDGVVDGSDFLTWQRGLGSPVTPAYSGADGDGNGTIDAGDLSVWRQGFGEFSLAEDESAAPLAQDAKAGSRAEAIDNIFAVGDFTSLFASDVLSGRSIRPQRRVAASR